MAEYIEREKVIELIDYHQEEYFEAESYFGLLKEDFLRLPSADVQPVTWIPVTERLPETRTRCVTISRDGDYGLGIYTTDYGWMFPYYMGETTHWMPLPEPPKDGEA